MTVSKVRRGAFGRSVRGFIGLGGATLVIPFAGCSTGAGGGEGAVDGTPVYLLDYQATVPVTWESREPTTSMRLAEFQTAGVEGLEGAEVVVFFFGPGQGGSVEANIMRWQGQFTSPEGGHVTPAVTVVDDGAFPVTVAELTGTYARSVGMGMNPDDARPDQSLVAAIVETPSGNMFVQLFGPARSVAAERDAFMAFVSGFEPRAPQS